jgi:hypothetical protein
VDGPDRSDFADVEIEPQLVAVLPRVRSTRCLVGQMKVSTTKTSRHWRSVTSRTSGWAPPWTRKAGLERADEEGRSLSSLARYLNS